MKKHLLGVFAVILAVGASAFTTTSTVSSNTTGYFWYQPDASGIVYPNTELFSNMAADKSTADANDGCEGTGAECIRGFESRIQEQTSNLGQEHTEKND